MITKVPRTIALILFLYTTCCMQSWAETGQCVEIIRSLRGQVYIKVTDSGREVRLTSRDVFRPLYSGDIIRCGPGGQITLAPPHSGRTQPITIKSGQAPYPIPDIVSQSNDPYDIAFRDFGRVAGRLRSNEMIAVVPGDFTIQWSVADFGTSVSIDVSAPEGTIWSSAQVRSSYGVFHARDLTEKLVKAPQSGMSRPYILTIFGKGGSSAARELKPLSVDDLSQLTRSLREVSVDDHLLANVERGMIFDSFNLPERAWLVYGAALKLAPLSTTLAARMYEDKNLIVLSRHLPLARMH